MRGLGPNFHIHVSVSDLYIPVIGPHILLQENMWTDPGNIYSSSQTLECGNWAEAGQFLFWKYMNGIFVALQALGGTALVTHNGRQEEG
jgi:hypothetical protein